MQYRASVEASSYHLAGPQSPSAPKRSPNPTSTIAQARDLLDRELILMATRFLPDRLVPDRLAPGGVVSTKTAVRRAFRYVTINMRHGR